MSFENHHLIPNSLKNHPVFLALQAAKIPYDRFELSMPNRKSAAVSAQVVQAPPADGVHRGGHYAAYTDAVKAYLDTFQATHLNLDGNLKPGQGDALVKNLQRLEMRFADVLTASQVPDGKGGFVTVAPEGALNGADPRIDSEATAERMQQFWRSLRDGAVDDIDSAEFGQLDKGHRFLSLLNDRDSADVANGTTGQRSATIKIVIADKAGLSGWGRTQIVTLGDVGQKKIERALEKLRKSADFRKFEEGFSKFAKRLLGDSSGSVAPGGALLGMSNKGIGALDAMAVGIAGLSVYQFASQYAEENGVTVPELISGIVESLDIEITPDMLADLATGIIKLAFEQAVLTFATGGVGTVLRLAVLARDAADGIDALRLALDLYKIAFPDGVLADIIEGVLPGELKKGEAFARAHIRDEGYLKFIGVDFKQFDDATSIVVADDSDAEGVNRDKLLAVGTNNGDRITGAPDESGVPKYYDSNGIDIIWGRNGAIVDGRGGNDLIFHTGYGQARGGKDNDVVISQDGRFVEEGTRLDPAMQALADARRTENQAIRAANIALELLGLPPQPELPELPDSPFALKDYYQTLDGGEGNDAVLALGEGKKVIVQGGIGRDWLFNTSEGGRTFGDTQTGYYEKVVGQDELGRDIVKLFPVLDISENADNFWYYPDTTIMDAQHFDVLKFYGIPLTGGNTALGGALGSIALTMVSGGVGIGGAAGIGATALSYDPALGRIEPTRGLFFDNLFPFITYLYKDGDLYVANVFQSLIAGLNGACIGATPVANDNEEASRSEVA